MIIITFQYALFQKSRLLFYHHYNDLPSFVTHSWFIFTTNNDVTRLFSNMPMSSNNETDLPCSLSFPLPSSVIIEISSYIVSDYSDLAKLRLISKQFNKSCFPFITRSNTCKLNCDNNGSRRSNKFIQELVDIDEAENRGSRHDMTAINQNFFITEETGIYLRIDSILIVDDFEEENWIDKTITHYEDEKMQAICNTLLDTQSFDEFLETSKEAINNGFFLPRSVTNYVGGKDVLTYPGCVCDHFDDFWRTILTISCYVDGTSIEANDGDIISVKLIDWMHESAAMVGPRKCDLGHTFRGFVKDGKVHVPIIVWLMDEIHWCGEYSTDLLPVAEITRKHLNSFTTPEGVSIVDGAIPKSLHDNIMQQIDEFATSQQVDYHPHSNDIVRDLVHPALYAYVKGKSSLEDIEEVPPCIFDLETHEQVKEDDTSRGDKKSLDNRDYWGRPYEASLKYQWLPTYFDVSADGTCTICDYINNLVPRSQYEQLYSSLEQLFAYALPQLESVYSYGRAIRPHLRVEEEEELDWMEDELSSLDPEFSSLKNQRLQVVTKIVDYELGPGESYEGVWHVEGMSHEEIVATAIYFLHRDEAIEGGNIAFKRAFHKKEANYIFSNVPQCRAMEQEKVIKSGLVPLGQVETLANRLLVFPNSHVHKVRKMQNKSTDVDKKRRRIVVFFLINPEKRIVSTREVKPQQEQMGGNLCREEALNHRLELMKERKYTKQDWNVREIELCEH